MLLTPLCAGAAPVTIPSGGLVIAADDASGRITALSVGGQSVMDAAGVPLSGFSVRDHARGADYVAVPTIIARDGDQWRLTGELDGIRLQAVFTPAGSGYTIKATLERLAGPDRFLSVRFGLPVDVTGWRWWRTLARSLAMRPGRDRLGGFRSGLGQGSADILPFAAASGPGVTVGFAVPMDGQLLHSVSYDGAARTLGITFDFALCDAVPPFARRVDFDFELFAPPDASGLRAIVAEYFALHPEWGETPCPPGGWCAWGDLAQHEEPLCDFGLLYHEGPTPAGARTCNALGIRNLPYIEPSMYQQYHGDLDRAPTVEEAWQRLRHNASVPLAEVIAARPEESHRLWVQAISAAIAHNPIYTGDGQPIAPLPGNWPWIGGTNYGVRLHAADLRLPGDHTQCAPRDHPGRGPGPLPLVRG